MALRFRRRVRLVPGVSMNLAKGGLSLSLGHRGGTVNIGRRGTYADAGIPGLGVSYRTRIAGGARRGAGGIGSVIVGLAFLALVIWLAVSLL